MSIVELIAARYEYWMTGALLLTGLHALLVKRNLMKKLIGLNILQSAIVLFFISLSVKPGGTIPILPHHAEHAAQVTEVYMSPLPHVLMLTAIVVMVATTGVALALLIRIHRHYGSLDESVLLGRRH
jgi:multicomponent Na+:H+ antiporter subunit C